jgi:hypothetical protein
VNVLLPAVLLMLGFIVGALFGTQILRWGALVWASTTTHGGDFLGPARRRLLWVFPFVLLLHPVPYLVAFAVVFTIWAFQGKVGGIWLLLVGGFYAYVVLASLMALRMYRLQRRRRAGASPNNRWRVP